MPDMMTPALTCGFTADAAATASIKLTSVLNGARIPRPIQLLSPPDGTKRVFVVSQTGRIVTAADAGVSTAAGDWLNLSAKVESTGAQSGLLGLAFDPAYTQNGRFYVSYTKRAGTTLQLVLSRFTVAMPLSGTPDAGSEAVLLTVDLQADGHVSGHIAFGPDGYLYLGTSDGGQDGDPQDNAKNLNSLLGKILRLDVSQGGSKYTIPMTNPMVGQAGVREEIWAYGLRNPSRFSIDPLSGMMLAGDQGQSTTEEIDAIYAGGNYGWNGVQGIDCYKPMRGCSLGGLYPPSIFYPRTDGGAVAGGLIYRGQKLPSLYGAYVFGDTVSGMLWALPARDDQQQDYVRQALGKSDRAVVGFGTDADGEMYVLDNKDGAICRIEGSGATQPTPVWPLLLSQTGYFTDVVTRKLATTVLSYDVNSPLWSDGATKERGLFLPAGAQIAYHDKTTAWEPPVGTVAIKTFLLSNKPIETRLLRNTADGWHGATYRWNATYTEANLMTSDAQLPIGNQIWPLPSRADCLRCHTKSPDSTGRLLGLDTAQMNRDHDMLGNGMVASQITTLKQQNKFSAPPTQDPSMLDRFPAPTETTALLALRARAYLHVQCAHCHQPGGLADATFDIRFTTPLKDTGLCNAVPQKGDGGVTGALLLTPKSPENSMVWIRMNSLGSLRMPALGSNVIDKDATDLIKSWIQSVMDCN